VKKRVGQAVHSLRLARSSDNYAPAERALVAFLLVAVD
jgi:hypothetical protein